MINPNGQLAETVLFSRGVNQRYSALFDAKRLLNTRDHQAADAALTAVSGS
jgi:hypothetical protein